ncbi:uncharacterized protein AMSG_06583, partial [Thecamonas trahens ATCC 50062]
MVGMAVGMVGGHERLLWPPSRSGTYHFGGGCDPWKIGDPNLEFVRADSVLEIRFTAEFADSSGPGPGSYAPTVWISLVAEADEADMGLFTHVIASFEPEVVTKTFNASLGADVASVRVSLPPSAPLGRYVLHWRLDGWSNCADIAIVAGTVPGHVAVPPAAPAQHTGPLIVVAVAAGFIIGIIVLVTVGYSRTQQQAARAPGWYLDEPESDELPTVVALTRPLSASDILAPLVGRGILPERVESMLFPPSPSDGGWSATSSTRSRTRSSLSSSATSWS